MTELTHVELYNQIEQGIIPDLKPYINKGEDYRWVIATTGQYVDELVKYGEVNVITTLIERGYAREYYELWKNHENARVRRILASKGLWPKDYIHDSDPVNELYSVVYSEPHVDTDILEHILTELLKCTTGLRPEKLQLKAVRTKLSATLHTPTLMETTMTSEALYDAGSPLWAKKMSIGNIWDIQRSMSEGLSFEEARGLCVM